MAALGLAASPDFERDDPADADDESSLAVLVMQQICAALYQLDHALQKAFTRIDASGTGWLPAESFAKVRRSVDLLLHSFTLVYIRLHLLDACHTWCTLATLGAPM